MLVFVKEPSVVEHALIIPKFLIFVVEPLLVVTPVTRMHEHSVVSVSRFVETQVCALEHDSPIGIGLVLEVLIPLIVFAVRQHHQIGVVIVVGQTFAIDGDSVDGNRRSCRRTLL